MCMHGFSRYTGSSGSSSASGVNYMVDEDYFDREQSVWLARDPLPEVIEGEPELMIQMIDALAHKHKYTSGVLSFTQSDTEKLKRHGLSEAITDITGRLKDMLFAGISSEYQHILIVKHRHLERLELHYMLPRHNYEVDRAWNPAPPGAGKLRQMDALVDFINIKYGLDDPRDPLRARVTQSMKWEKSNKKTTRETLNNFFKNSVIEGVIDNREELIDLAIKAGFEITRMGKDYVSMKAPGETKAIRLKGELYNEQFTSRAELADTKTKSAERTAYLAKPAVAQRYKQAIRERQVFVENRFKKALGTIRAGKSHSETQKFNSAKRGEILEIHNGCAGNYVNKFSNQLNYNNNGVRNDGFGKEAASVITRAERAMYNTQQSASTASRIFAAGAEIVQSAPRRLRVPALKYPYGAPRKPPLASVGTAGLAISDVAGGVAVADTGDPDSDRILTAKRQEAVESAQRSADRAKQDALGNQRKVGDDFNI